MKVWVARVCVVRKAFTGQIFFNDSVTYVDKDWVNLCNKVYRHMETYSKDLYECNVAYQHLDENDRKLW